MEVKKIHIGQIVEEACNQSNYTKVQIAKDMQLSKQSLNNRFKKDDWSVKELFTISKILGCDFVAQFTQPKDPQPQRTKVVLQVEVEEGKTNEVLDYIRDKGLSRILKNQDKT